MARESVRGGIHLFVGNLSSTLISALAVILIARLLGPSNYGLYSISLIIPSLLVLFTDFGVNPALIKYSAQFKSRGEEGLIADIIRTGVFFKLFISLVILAISLPFSDFLASSVLKRPQLSSVLQIALLLVVGQPILSTASNLFIGLDSMEYTACLTMTQSIIRAVVAPLLIIIGLGVVGAVLGSVLSYMVMGFISALLLLKLYRRFKGRGELSEFNAFKTLIKYGFPLYITSILSGLIIQYRRLILTWFTTDFEIGNYVVALNFSTLITILSYPISMALFPAFSKISLRNEWREMHSLFKHSIKYISLVIIPASTFTIIFSRELVYLIYGLNYALASTYLAIYVTLFLYTGFGYLVLGNFFNGIGETKITLKMALIGVFISLILAPTLTILLRVNGLIFSILLSSLASIIYGLIVSKNRFGMSVDFKALIKIYLASFISGALTLISFKHLSLGIPLLDIAVFGSLFFILYLTITPLIKAVDKRDLRNLREIVSQMKLIRSIFEPILSYEEKLLESHFI